jgi:hypothetical protein
MLWIPLILVLWNNSPNWTIFPPPQYPYNSITECQEAIAIARSNIMQYPNYLQGFSMCIPFNVNGENT